MKQSEREERRKKVKELYEENAGKGKPKGVIVKEIARQLDVCENTISKDIKYWIGQGDIKDEKQERMQKVKELYVAIDEKTKKQKIKKIADQLGKSPVTISKDVEALEKSGEKFQEQEKEV